MKKVLGLAVAMAVASQANAEIDLPQIDVNNTGGSELVLVIYDEVNKTTYARDLGIDYKAFDESTDYSFTADARLTSLFGSTLNSSLLWAIWASDAVDSGNEASGFDYTYGASYMTTSSKELADLPKITSEKIANANGALTNFINATNTLVNGTHLTQADGSSTAIEGQNAKSADFGYNMKSNWSQSFPASSAVAVGSDAYFVLAQSVYNETYLDVDEDGVFTEGVDITTYEGDFERAAAMTQFAGLWNLDANGTLTWAASTTAVPVPAAVWLFVSGLAGLAGIARRRKA